MAEPIKAKIITSDEEIAVLLVEYISRYSSKHKSYPNRLMLSGDTDLLLISRDPVIDDDFRYIISEAYDNDRIDLTPVGPLVSEFETKYFEDFIIYRKIGLEYLVDNYLERIKNMCPVRLNSGKKSILLNISIFFL